MYIRMLYICMYKRYCSINVNTRFLCYAPTPLKAICDVIVSNQFRTVQYTKMYVCAMGTKAR